MKKLWLLQNGIPLHQGADGGDLDPAFREERRVHRVPREKMVGQSERDTTDTAAENTSITAPPPCAGGRKQPANGNATGVDILRLESLAGRAFAEECQ